MSLQWLSDLESGSGHRFIEGTTVRAHGTSESGGYVGEKTAGISQAVEETRVMSRFCVVIKTEDKDACSHDRP